MEENENILTMADTLSLNNTVYTNESIKTGFITNTDDTNIRMGGNVTHIPNHIMGGMTADWSVDGSYVNMWNEWNSTELYKDKLDNAITQFSNVIELLEKLKQDINDLDENQAKTIMTAKSDKGLENNIWYTLNDNVPNLNSIISTNFSWTDDTVKDFIVKYAKTKLKEILDGNND